MLPLTTTFQSWQRMLNMPLRTWRIRQGTHLTQFISPILKEECQELKFLPYLEEVEECTVHMREGAALNMD